MTTNRMELLEPRKRYRHNHRDNNAMQTCRILCLVASIFRVTLAFYGGMLSQENQTIGRLSKTPRSLYILHPSELNQSVYRYQSEASVVVQKLPQRHQQAPYLRSYSPGPSTAITSSSVPPSSSSALTS